MAFVIRHLVFTQRFQTLFRAIAFIRSAVFQHFVDHAVIAVKTFGLEIRAFIPVQIQPVHAIHNRVDSFLSGTLEIGVFDTQHKLTAKVAGKEPGIECGTGATDVQIAGRAWGKTGFDFHPGATLITQRQETLLLINKKWLTFYHSALIPQR